MDRARCNVRAWQCLLMSSSDSMRCGGPPSKALQNIRTMVPEIQNRARRVGRTRVFPASVRNAMLSAIAPRREERGCNSR